MIHSRIKADGVVPRVRSDDSKLLDQRYRYPHRVHGPVFRPTLGHLLVEYVRVICRAPVCIRPARAPATVRIGHLQRSG
jgi:hypothetical protein